MRLFGLISCLLALLLPIAADCGNLAGRVIEVNGDTVVASFPAPVKSRAMMILLSGEGESVAGMAVADKCYGSGPYNVYGKLSFVSDASNIAAGKRVYVNSANVTQVVGNTISSVPRAEVAQASTDRDMNLYYYAAGQNVGYGALGIGLNKTFRVSRGIGVELDGGITALGNVDYEDGDSVNTDQLIKNLVGRLKFDFGSRFGVYSGYRWNEGRGDQEHWDDLQSELYGKNFIAASDQDWGTVLTQGFEYGLTFRPARKFSLSLGYIPEFRAEYGSLGTLSEPAYTGEIRFGSGTGAVRLRGLTSDDYWQADLGITIK